MCTDCVLIWCNFMWEFNRLVICIQTITSLPSYWTNKHTMCFYFRLTFVCFWIWWKTMQLSSIRWLGYSIEAEYLWTKQIFWLIEFYAYSLHKTMLIGIKQSNHFSVSFWLTKTIIDDLMKGCLLNLLCERVSTVFNSMKVGG